MNIYGFAWSALGALLYLPTVVSAQPLPIAALDGCTVPITAPPGYVISKIGATSYWGEIKVVISRTDEGPNVSEITTFYVTSPIEKQEGYSGRDRQPNSRTRVRPGRSFVVAHPAEDYLPANDMKTINEHAYKLTILPLFMRSGSPFCMRQAAQIPPPGLNNVQWAPKTKFLFFSEYGAPVRAAIVVDFDKAPAPTIDMIDPSSGTVNGGTPVTITGKDLFQATSVVIGSAITLDSATATSIVLKTPKNVVGPIDVSVTTPSGTDTKKNAYTYK
jgi:hypothetical protein